MLNDNETAYGGFNASSMRRRGGTGIRATQKRHSSKAMGLRPLIRGSGFNLHVFQHLLGLHNLTFVLEDAWVSVLERTEHLISLSMFPARLFRVLHSPSTTLANCSFLSRPTMTLFAALYILDVSQLSLTERCHLSYQQATDPRIASCGCCQCSLPRFASRSRTGRMARGGWHRRASSELMRTDFVEPSDITKHFAERCLCWLRQV